jgi:hypothetical protein
VLSIVAARAHRPKASVAFGRVSVRTTAVKKASLGVPVL